MFLQVLLTQFLQYLSFIFSFLSDKNSDHLKSLRPDTLLLAFPPLSSILGITEPWDSRHPKVISTYEMTLSKNP